MKPQMLLVLVVASFAAIAADPALARQNRGRRSKARAVLVADDTSAAAGAKLSIRLKGASNGRWEMRLAIENAPADLAPEAWIADADGTLVLVGSLAADDDGNGEYKLRLRGREGDPLPAGAATFTDLGGRAFEIRSGDAVILSGNLPELAAPGASSSTGGTGGTGGADDPATHDAGDDHGVDGATHDATDDHGATADDPATHDATDDDPATHDATDDSAGTTTGGSTSTTTTTSSGSGSGNSGSGGGNSGSGNSGGSGGHGGNDGSGHH